MTIDRTVEDRRMENTIPDILEDRFQAVITSFTHT